MEGSLPTSKLSSLPSLDDCGHLAREAKKSGVLQAHTTKLKIAAPIQYLLNDLAKTNKITLIWVREHSGIRENTMAADLAKLRAKTVVTGSEPIVGICNSLVNNESTMWTTNQKVRDKKKESSYRVLQSRGR